MPRDIEKLCGWRENPRGVEAVINDPAVKHPVFNVAARNVLANYTKKDTHLWAYLTWAFPNYRRGAQALGSCVGWGAELACTILTCKHAKKKNRKSLALEVSTESCYGGSRCEARGKTFAGWSDGSYGAAAAKFVNEWGVLYRKNYAEITGNPEHDLRKYDGKKEKNWGAYGNGGQNDKNKLDEVAREHPVKTISQVNSFDDVAAAIAGSQASVTIASNYGAGSMRRNKYGECGWTSNWSHQMMLSAIRFGQRPGALCMQSWGPNSASGPMGDEYTENLPPGGTPKNIAGFSWWVPAEIVDRICRSGDCWAMSDLSGWRIDKADWSKAWGKL